MIGARLFGVRAARLFCAQAARCMIGRGVRLFAGWSVLWGFAALLGGPPQALGYVPSLEEVYRQIAASQPGVTRIVLESESEVFDPLGRFTPAPAEPLGADAPPPQASGRAFRRKVYWIRDRLLAVETFSLSGKRLHIYLREGPRPVQENFDPARLFDSSEVLPVYLPFLSGDPTWWRKAANFWGVAPYRVDLVRAGKGEMLYRMEDGPRRAVWVRPESLVVTRLDAALEGGETPGALTFEFAEFIMVPGSPPQGGTLSYPLTINVLLDGRLIRRTRLLRLDIDPSVQGFPITRLRKDAERILDSERLDAAVGMKAGARP